MRDIVAETLVDLPMLRSVERRMVLEVRHICVHMHMHMHMCVCVCVCVCV